MNLSLGLIGGRRKRYPAGLLSLWNAKTPTTCPIGPQIQTSAAGTVPDADGNMVAFPVNHPGRGVMVQPAYTQLAVNSVLAGAVAGSPGTTPTGWTYTVVGSPTMAVTDVEGENKLTFSGTASRGYLSLSQAVAALAVYTFDVMVTTDGVLRYADIEYCSLTGGTIVVMKDGVIVADETAVPAAGTFKLSVKVTAGAVGDTAIFRFGLGASAVATGTVSVWQPQLTLGAYSLPYVRSTTESVLIPSTAATSLGIGAAIPLNLGIKRSLGGMYSLVAIGDSITLADYPLVLKELHPKTVIYDKGVSGNKTADVLARLQTDVYALNASYVALLIGINDIATDVPIATIQANLTAILSSLTSTGCRVALSLLTPWKGATLWSAGRQEVTDTLNTWIPSLAASFSGVVVVDNYTPLEDPENPDALLAAYDTGDHMHPNSAGAAVMAGKFDAVAPWAELTNITDSIETSPGTSSTLARKADWAVTGEDATHTITDVASGMRFKSGTTSPALTFAKTNVLTVGSTYRMVVKVSNYTSGSIKTSGMAASDVTFTKAETKIVFFVATGPHISFTRNVANTDLTIGWISVQRIQPSVFTAAALIYLGASSAEVTSDTNILAFNNSATGGIYAAAGGVLKAFDGTNTATVTVAGGWARGETPLIAWKTNAAGTKQYIGYKKEADADITWGAEANYDGSVNPSTHLRWGYTIDKSIGAIQSQVWGKPASNVEILKVTTYA